MVLYKSEGYSKKNTKSMDKPNEDCYICDDKNGIYIVLDGVSRDRQNGVYPNPSPAAEVSDLVLKTLHNTLVKQLENNKLNIYDAICQANITVCNYNEEHQTTVGDFFAGTVGVIVVIKNGIMSYGYIGDAVGVILQNNEIIEFTKQQTKNVAAHKGEYTAYEIRNIICNNASHLCGYGVINGQEGARDFIETGQLVLRGNSMIFLSSDGCKKIFKTVPIEKLKTLTPREVTEEYTKQDNDDKTLVIIREKGEHK